MQYHWQMKGWPAFTGSLETVEENLLLFMDTVGQLQGQLGSLSDESRNDAVADLMITEAMRSSEIEGELLHRPDVASSIRRRLGLDAPPHRASDPASIASAEMMADAREQWEQPLTEKMIFDWHRTLLEHDRRITAGAWRMHPEPMQVVAGPIDKPTVCYEAPPSGQIPKEMSRYISWFNQAARDMHHPPVRSAIAHLYFLSIHPFEDGNGRIGRALAEKAASQALGRPVPFSLSQAIIENKRAYYDALMAGQRTLDLTEWVAYFLQLSLAAMEDAGRRIGFVLDATRFWDDHGASLNERQRMVIRRMMRDGPEGFEGGMNARKYIALTGTSKATATRDLQTLVTKGILRPIGGGGRSTRYALVLSG
jgi:Fic family protein